jgi:hypothetical protein
LVVKVVSTSMDAMLDLLLEALHSADVLARRSRGHRPLVALSRR